MALIRGTRAAHDGRPQHGGGPPPTARYATAPMWPGITGPFDSRCWGCTWGTREGVYQVKVRHADCPVHRSATRA